MAAQSQAAAQGPERLGQVDPVPAAPFQAAAQGQQAQEVVLTVEPFQAEAQGQQAQEVEEQRVLPAGVMKAAVVPAFAPAAETTHRQQALQV